MILNIIKRRANWFSALFLALFILQACTKPEEIIGSEVLPEKDVIGTAISDTTTLEIYSQKAEGVRTDELSSLLIGSYNDQATGVVNTAASFQFRLSSLNVDFGNEDQIVVDSVRLFLDYSPYYLGDSSTALQLEVYELESDLYLDSAYFSDAEITTKPENLLVEDFEFKFRPNTALVVEGDSVSGGMWLPLKNAFGEKIIAEGGNSSLATNDEFLQFIKGLQVKSNTVFSPGQGLVLSVNPLNLYSKLYIYYRDTVAQDTNVFDLLINENSARITTSEHEFSGSDAQMFLADSTLRGENVWLKAHGGISAMVQFPFLEDYRNIPGFTINSAILSIEPDDMDSTLKTPISALLLLPKNEDGEEFILPDLLEGEVFYGGVIIDDKYQFRITEYLQQVLRGTYPNSGLEIVSRNSGVTANRSVLLTSTLKLKIIYSTF